jgi:two-component system, NtrC family, sensor kinase
VSLRLQISLLLLVTSSLLVACTYGVMRLAVMPSFVALEQAEAIKDVDRGVEAIERDMEHLGALVADWAHWDESYQYVQDRNRAFEDRSMGIDAMQSGKINALGIFDSKGELVWADMATHEPLEKVDRSDLLQRLRNADADLLIHESADSAKHAVLPTRYGPLLLVATTVTNTAGDAPPLGTLMMGRLLTEELRRRIVEQTNVPLTIWYIGGDEIPESRRPWLERASQSGDKAVVDERDSDIISTYRVMRTSDGAPILLVAADVPRSILQRGRLAVMMATGACGTAGLVILAILWLMLQYRIVGPLMTFAKHADRVGATGDLRGRLEWHRGDEIGQLGEHFDAMVDQLAQSRVKMLDQAHRAGMAEIATDVLHNVGNAMVSVTAAMESLESMQAVSKPTGLQQTSMLLDQQQSRLGEFFTDDPRGPKLVDYIRSLAAKSNQQHEQQAHELGKLRQTIQHIREIVAAQQTHAGSEEQMEDVELPTLVEASLTMHKALIDRLGIDLQLNYGSVSSVRTCKRKLLQVLVNLIKNGIESIQEADRPNPRIEIALRNGDGRVEWSITDSGVGMDRDQLGKAFRHGYTTKLNGHGFGLHFCANAIQQLGGSIQASSPGVGLGATFKVQLPTEAFVPVEATSA